MPTFDVPTAGGTYRVEAPSAKEAYKLYTEGQGELLAPTVPRPGPGENPVIAPPQPPPASGGTVYIPPGPPQQTETPLLNPVLDWAAQKVAPAAWDVAKPAILPTTIGAALNYGGGAVPGLNALPPPARESLGSVIGTGINMLTGIEQPSLSGLALSAVSPGATRKSAQVGTKLLPGAQAARATGLVEEAQALPGKISQGLAQDTTGALFTQARKQNPTIDMSQTTGKVRELLAHEQTDVELPTLQFPTVRNLAQQMDKSIVAKAGAQGGTPLAQLDAWRQRIGSMIDVTDNTEEQRALRALYGSLLNDLEAAAPQVGGEGAATLLKGIEQQRRLFSAGDLQDLITTATSRPRPVDGLQTLNVGSILKSLESPRGQQQTLLADFFEKYPSEKAEIVSLLEDMNRRNVKLMPPAGTMAGSMMTGVRGSAGYLAGQGINAVVGSDVVNPMVTGGLAVVGSQAISRALLTPVGRAAIKQMLAESGEINIAQLLTQFGGQAARANLGPPAVDLAQRVSTRATGFPGYPEERR